MSEKKSSGASFEKERDALYGDEKKEAEADPNKKKNKDNTKDGK